MAKWAVFDVDGTLIRGPSLERSFISHLINERVIPYKNLIVFLTKGFFKKARGKLDARIKADKGYLKNIEARILQEKVEPFFDQYIVPRVLKQARESVEDHKKNGYKVMLLSGTLDILANQFTKVSHFDHIASTKLEIKEGKYTGKIIGVHPFGKGKKSLLEELSGELDIDFPESIVFADHPTDVLHMDLFGNAVAVNPDEGMDTIAKNRDWKIESWR